MPSLSHRYREFGAPETPQAETPAATSLPDSDVEDLQLASFEAGYQAGWEDAIKAQADTSEQAAVQMSQNLQDMAFTHREAYLKLSQAMRPLMTQMVHQLLPQIAHQMLGTHILSQMSDLMEKHAENAIEIVVAPEKVEEIGALLTETGKVPFALVADEQLSAGQAYLKVNDAEREINLTAVLNGISDALTAFYEQADLEIPNG